MKTEQHTEAEWKLMRHDYMIESIASMNAQQLQAISWFFGYPTTGPDAWTVASIVKKLTVERAPLHEKVVNEKRKDGPWLRAVLDDAKREYAKWPEWAKRPNK